MSQPQLNSKLNITLPNSVGLDTKMGLHTRISSGCSTKTLSLGLGSFGMAELKSAVLFGVERERERERFIYSDKMNNNSLVTDFDH